MGIVNQIFFEIEFHLLNLLYLFVKLRRIKMDAYKCVIYVKAGLKRLSSTMKKKEFK